MSLHSYTVAQNTTENPRQTEYRLFAQVTRSLLECKGEDSKSLLAKSIHWNRRLWLALQADCALENNLLPDETRAGIISLAIWVDKHSRKVLRGEAEIEPLIDVNRSIMEGLSA
ncbi:MAG: flagellar biosynthesis regulator FlaF [Rhodospirillaceae bacterium]|jgi:flagellar protein FlaF|nr:flagellar biosynthesis regulator FlaF [Rhodospirillaceae bacterium]MBT4046405.1 flagellar biosynthesis regulator FlaF [Rhodospirillaceae bacterium]MBT4691295.1 flagellar biosynthesis regulator FlaF [Rhodospirillaceae bacterium]MBT5081127.1 flagellar biosynthesis regulator FlaF [Rhodospirillaceae bacterium]MBT5524654.1 flagellar biosynthesis regulator FlaF [Rhodospirillaceae bacterium]